MKQITAASILDAFAKLKPLPKLLSVIYATPGAVAKLPRVEKPPPGPLDVFMPAGRSPLRFGIELVTLPTAAECEFACRQAIAEGKRAAVMTETYWSEPRHIESS